MSEDVTIADAIKQLRTQLEDAQNEGADKLLRFMAKNVEVELTVVFKSELEGGGGVKAWFLDVSGKARSADETTHKVKLVLEPVDRAGKPTLVSSSELEGNQPARGG